MTTIVVSPGRDVWIGVEHDMEPEMLRTRFTPRIGKAYFVCGFNGERYRLLADAIPFDGPVQAAVNEYTKEPVDLDFRAVLTQDTSDTIRELFWVTT